MYVIARTTKLKKMGEIYKEEVVETQYKMVTKVETTSKLVLITYKESKGRSGELVETTDAIGTREIVGISIYD